MISTMLLVNPTFTLDILQERDTPRSLLFRKIRKANRLLNLNIQKFPPGFPDDEDRMAQFLFDIQNFPIPLVLQRLQEAGAILYTI